MYCLAGIFGGNIQVFAKFLTRMQEVFGVTPWQENCDMAVFNYVIRVCIYWMHYILVEIF